MLFMLRAISFGVPCGRNATDICHLVVIIGCRVSNMFSAK